MNYLTTTQDKKQERSNSFESEDTTMFGGETEKDSEQDQDMTVIDQTYNEEEE